MTETLNLVVTSIKELFYHHSHGLSAKALSSIDKVLNTEFHDTRLVRLVAL